MERAANLIEQKNRKTKGNRSKTVKDKKIYIDDEAEVSEEDCESSDLSHSELKDFIDDEPQKINANLRLLTKKMFQEDAQVLKKYKSKLNLNKSRKTTKTTAVCLKEQSAETLRFSAISDRENEADLQKLESTEVKTGFTADMKEKANKLMLAELIKRKEVTQKAQNLNVPMKIKKMEGVKFSLPYKGKVGEIARLKKYFANK